MKKLSFAIILAVAGAAPASADPLPSVRLISTFSYDTMLSKLKEQPLFVNLNKDQYGDPVILTVTNSTLPTAAGVATGLASAIFAGGTLGLLPVVENKDLAINYDLYVHGTRLLSTVYQKNFTSVTSMYSKHDPGELSGDGLAWALLTAEQFSTAAQSDPKVVDLISEYHFYMNLPK